MDLLLAEIAKKKKANEDLRNRMQGDPTGTSNAFAGVKSKYVKAGDRKRALELEQEEGQGRLDGERNAKMNLQRVADKSSSFSSGSTNSSDVDPSLKNTNTKTNGQGSSSKNATNTNTNTNYAPSNNIVDMESRERFIKLSLKQLMDRLRKVGAPITLFGEGTNKESRITRLVGAEAKQKVTKEEDDDKVKTAKADEEEAELDEEDRLESNADKHLAGSSSSGKKTDASKAEDSDSDKDEDGKKKGGNFGPVADIMERLNFTKIVPSLSAEKLVYRFFRYLTKQWEWDLNNRIDAEKSTMKGKMDTRTQKQCKDYIRPLFKLCKKKEVPFDILSNLVKMVRSCEEGNYREAHDSYLSCAIGNSAWPLGLTMVGIHERSGRERISTNKVAHMMNNELQRKYLTSVMRLISYAQNKSPSVNPSMKVMH